MVRSPGAPAHPRRGPGPLRPLPARSRGVRAAHLAPRPARDRRGPRGAEIRRDGAGAGGGRGIAPGPHLRAREGGGPRRASSGISDRQFKDVLTECVLREADRGRSGVCSKQQLGLSADGAPRVTDDETFGMEGLRPVETDLAVRGYLVGAGVRHRTSDTDGKSDRHNDVGCDGVSAAKGANRVGGFHSWIHHRTAVEADGADAVNDHFSCSLGGPGERDWSARRRRRCRIRREAEDLHRREDGDGDLCRHGAGNVGSGDGVGGVHRGRNIRAAGECHGTDTGDGNVGGVFHLPDERGSFAADDLRRSRGEADNARHRGGGYLHR